MKTYLTNAFAEGHLQQIREFHLWLQNLNATNYPYLQLPHISRLQRKYDPLLLFHAIVFGASACSKHLDFLKVNQANIHTACDCKTIYLHVCQGSSIHTPWADRSTPGRHATTGSLTTTILIYTIGAGITAAAGTRLALQLVLCKYINVVSFHIQDNTALHCYLLSLPPYIRIG